MPVLVITTPTVVQEGSTLKLCEPSLVIVLIVAEGMISHARAVGHYFAGRLYQPSSYCLGLWWEGCIS